MSIRTYSSDSKHVQKYIPGEELDHAPKTS
jgi:hypothetical protein